MLPGWCCIAIAALELGNGDSWYHMCTFRFHFWGPKVNWNQASHVRASSVQKAVKKGKFQPAFPFPSLLLSFTSSFPVSSFCFERLTTLTRGMWNRPEPSLRPRSSEEHQWHAHEPLYLVSFPTFPLCSFHLPITSPHNSPFFPFFSGLFVLFGFLFFSVHRNSFLFFFFPLATQSHPSDPSFVEKRRTEHPEGKIIHSSNCIRSGFDTSTQDLHFFPKWRFPFRHAGNPKNFPSHGWPWLSIETAMVTWGYPHFRTLKISRPMWTILLSVILTSLNN